MKVALLILIFLLFAQLAVTQHNFNYQRPQDGRRKYLRIKLIFMKLFGWNPRYHNKVIDCRFINFCLQLRRLQVLLTPKVKVLPERIK